MIVRIISISDVIRSVRFGLKVLRFLSFAVGACVCGGENIPEGCPLSLLFPLIGGSFPAEEGPADVSAVIWATGAYDIKTEYGAPPID